MSWDNVTLVILAAFGCVMLLLTQIAEVLSKLPEIIRAWREVRRALQAGPDDLPEAQGPPEATDPARVSGGGSTQRAVTVPDRPSGGRRPRTRCQAERRGAAVPAEARSVALGQQVRSVDLDRFQELSLRGVHHCPAGHGHGGHSLVPAGD